MNLNFQKSSGQLEKHLELKIQKNKFQIKYKTVEYKWRRMLKFYQGSCFFKRDQTITVDVTRRIKHKLYKKIIRQTKKYHAHDENNEFNVGDIVQ